MEPVDRHTMGAVMSHSKDLPAGHNKNLLSGHSKDVLARLNADEVSGLVRDLIHNWGAVEAPTLRDVAPAALVGLATRSVMALAGAGMLSVDQSAELQGRIQALEVLAAGPEFSTTPTGAPPVGVYEALSSTLPDTSLATSWNVLLTALVATAAVLGTTVAAKDGADTAAAEMLVAWPGWRPPA
jgi:hypothetical protein